MSTTDCRYDYYQITMQVNLSEEDSCLFSKYGQTVFSIKKADSKKDCKTCAISKPNTDPEQPPQVMQVVASIPDASILSIDIDRCDCTKATFNLLVRLPCMRVCFLSRFELTEMQSQVNFIIDSVKNLLPKFPFLNDEINAFESAYNDLLKTNCDTFLAAIRRMIAATQALRKELIGDGQLPDDGSNTLIAAIDNLLGQLQTLLDSMLLNSEPNNGYFRNTKFCITSVASGYDRELVTFYVRPLDPSVVSTGVFEKCYSYEITRVPARSFIPAKGSDQDIYTQCADGRLIRVDSGCTRPCVEVQTALVPDTLHITFPLTKDLKCLLPDFGIPGTVSNAYLGKLTTIVKIVSNCPQKFSFPAKMTFDKINCTVCLEISTSAVYDYLNKNNGNGYPYNSEFGRLGCEVLCRDTRCKDELSIASLFENGKLSATGAGAFFTLLSMSRKLDVVGVHKCTEKTFFSFQICTVPYKPLCIDICGCKLQTIPAILDKAEGAVYATNWHCLDLGTNPLCRFGFNSFSVQAECDYTYEFSASTMMR